MSAGIVAGTATGTRRNRPKNGRPSGPTPRRLEAWMEGRGGTTGQTLGGAFVPLAKSLKRLTIFGGKKWVSRPLSRSVSQLSFEGNLL